MSDLMARGIVWWADGRRPRPILDGVDLDVEPGVTALVGANGAGKTTLLRILAGLLPPVEGHIEAGGVALQDRPSQVRRLVGYLPQFPALYRRLTVLQHFERQAAWMGPAATGVDDAAADPFASRADHALALLEHWGLAALRHWTAGRLDPGQRKQLALALLWARGVRVALLDEPTAGLDPEERWRFWERILDPGQAKPPTAIVVTTHLLDEVETYAATVVHLVGGRVAFQGSRDRLPQKAVGRTALGAPGDQRLRGDGALEVGVEVDGRPRLFLTGHAPMLAPGWASRPPTVLDGYLAVELLTGRTTDEAPPEGAGGGGRSSHGRQ